MIRCNGSTLEPYTPPPKTRKQYMPNRKSIRLKDYNYAQNGYYFITICTKNREHLFGKIKQGKLQKTKLAEVADEYWSSIPKFHPNAFLDEFVLMPNHLHGIIIIENNFKQKDGSNIGHIQIRQNRNEYQKIIPGSIGSIIRGFKAGVTKWAKENINRKKIWHRNFYEHIIRNDQSLYKIRNYIKNNPISWEEDMFHKNKGTYTSKNISKG